MPTKPNRADYAPNRNGESAYRRDLRAYEAAINPQPQPQQSPLDWYLTNLARSYGFKNPEVKTKTPLKGLADIRGSVTPGSIEYPVMEPAPTNIGEGIQMDIAERFRAGAGYPEGVVRPDYYPVSTRNSTRNTYSGSAPAPNGDALGTQMSPRQPTPDQMYAFLGAIRNQAGANPEEIARGRTNLAEFARPFADLVSETEIEAPEVAEIMEDPIVSFDDAANIAEVLAGAEAGASDYSENLSDDAIKALKFNEATPFEGTTSRSEINEAVRARQRRLKEERMRKQEMEKIESAPKSETTTQEAEVDRVLAPISNEERRRRDAFLEAPDSLSGLKRREMMRGYITAGGQKYAITPEFIKSGDAKDLGPVLTSQQVAQAKAQELLANTVENVRKSPAVTQTPMLGEFEGPDPAFGKVSAELPENEGIFVENNATEFDLNPLGDDFENISKMDRELNAFPNLFR